MPRSVIPHCSGGARAAAPRLVDAVDVASLSSQSERLGYLTSLDRLAAQVAALQYEVLAALAGDTPSGVYLDEVHLEHEIALARRTSRYAAGKSIETARALATTFATFRAALHAGEITASHCSVLVERTQDVTDPDALSRIERLALPKARRLTPGELGREVRALVVRLDRDSVARHAHASRRVWTRELDDGMSYLGLVHDTTLIQSVRDAITADALEHRHTHRTTTVATADAVPGATAPAGHGDGVDHDQVDVVGPLRLDREWEFERLDALRADALVARLLGQTDQHGTLTYTPREHTTLRLDLVLDLQTLRGEIDHPCLLDGTPLPAEVGRELAGLARAWRRLITDPRTGHLLDKGRTRYLPDGLRDYVLTRDGGCRSPGCTTRDPRRLQLDHATPYPHGPSDTANTGALCTTCHQLKTARHATIENSAPDGSATWTTRWGQHIHIPPRRYLLGTDPEPPAPVPEPAEDPPPY